MENIIARDLISVGPHGTSSSGVQLPASTISADLPYPLFDGGVNRSTSARFSDYTCVLEFGAIGDGVADDTAAIQAAINYVAYVRQGGTVFMPQGRYKTSDTLHLGYGVAYNGTPYTTVNLMGAGRGSSISGKVTNIIPTFRDRPVIAISGGRQSSVTGISFIGDSAYMEAQGLHYPAGQQADIDTHPGNALAADVVTWINPAWPANAASRYAPFAAIAVDPYLGSAPTPAYPNVIFPSFLGTPAQYNKSASSDVIIEDNFFEGFTVAIVCTPSGGSLQGDFVRVHFNWIRYCIYGCSVGHTDARLMSFSWNYINQCHTGLAGDAHGQQLGQFGSVILNTGFDRCVNWITLSDVSNERGGPVTLLNCYGENCWRIGKYGTFSTGAVSGNATFILENITFIASYYGALGRPSNILEIRADANLKIIGGSFRRIEGPIVVLGRASNVSVEAASFFTQNDAVQPYEKYGRTLSPIIVADMSNGPADFGGRWRAYDAQTGSGISRECLRGVARSDKSLPAPLYAATLLPSARRQLGFSANHLIGNPVCGQLFNKSDFASMSLSGLDLTITFTSRDDILFSLGGGLPGDVIVDVTTGSVFFVYNRTTTTILAKLQNNYRSNGSGGYTNQIPIDTTLNSTKISFLNSRVFTPADYTKGDLTSGSNMITNAGSDDISYTTLAIDIPINSAIYTDRREDHIVSLSGSANLITYIDSVAKTITMTGNAVKTETRRQFGIFVLPAPANI